MMSYCIYKHEQTQDAKITLGWGLFIPVEGYHLQDITAEITQF